MNQTMDTLTSSKRINRKNRRNFGCAKNNSVMPKGALQPKIKEIDITKGLIGLQKKQSRGLEHNDINVR